MSLIAGISLPFNAYTEMLPSGLGNLELANSKLVAMAVFKLQDGFFRGFAMVIMQMLPHRYF